MQFDKKSPSLSPPTYPFLPENNGYILKNYLKCRKNDR
uniref:Uncharacterized protein n=1 Tax=Siphoviridae sp. ctC6Q17 TaxID=2827271 RepID=A0A8S5R2W6_9CAUD|nr:MAG TPA: hypothetical protein [Siphoviridae sp. ctC6Q17]